MFPLTFLFTVCIKRRRVRTPARYFVAACVPTGEIQPLFALVVTRTGSDVKSVVTEQGMRGNLPMGNLLSLYVNGGEERSDSCTQYREKSPLLR